jgi:hypothetical protein
MRTSDGRAAADVRIDDLYQTAHDQIPRDTA